MELRVRVSRKGWCELVNSLGRPIEQANRFLRALEIRGLSPRTVQAYGYDLLDFYRWLERAGKNLKDLTQADLFQFMAVMRKRNAEANTINRRLTAIQLLYRFYYDKDLPRGGAAIRPSLSYWGHRDHVLGVRRIPKRNPMRLRVKTPERVIEPLDPKEVRRFLGEFSKARDVSIVLLMLLCGLRSCEVLSLKPDGIDLLERTVRIRGKGNKERVVPLPEALVESLTKYLRLERPLKSTKDTLFVALQGEMRGSPMTRAGIRSLFRHRRAALKIPKAHPHRFRHTFGTDMARSGVRLPVLQKMMGHANPGVTLRYINLAMQDVSDEYKRVMEKMEHRYDL